MVGRVVPLALIAWVAAPCLCAGPSLAGSPYYQDQQGQPRQPARQDPDASGVPNVPNLQGCVKLCERDTNPCDPMLYKQTDGRCNATD